jgi:glycosyltransferase involved in cell wall biosynthesis
VHLSILLHSNRDLAGSRRSIETALAFCQQRDALLIVSDNSGDRAKRKLLENASPRLRYIQPVDGQIHTNLRTVLAAAETEFVMLMGDDDELFVSPKDVPLDLATLPADCIGVRPLIAVMNSEGRVMRVKDFAIDAPTPGSRVMAYNDKSGGDNAAYYSIFRRKPYVDLFNFFLDHHPLKAGYCDWALASVMFSYGKLPYDPGVVFKYNYHQWDSDEKLARQVDALYAAVGLPETTRRFKLLLLYLDLVIMAVRKGSPLDDAGKRDLMQTAGWPILQGFLKTMSEAPDLFDENAKAQAAAMAWETDPWRQLERAIAMADCLMPGLTERYDAFHRVAMEG